MPFEMGFAAYWRSGVCIAALSLGAVPAYAQEASADTALAEEQAGVGEIIVTANKRQESSNTVGMSISALSSDALEQQGISNIEQLVKVVPGFNYTRSAYGAPVYTLRGIGFNETSLAASPTVSVYVDEVPLPYSTMTQGATLDIERVEVLKGPQGTLFGQNSTGGAINYIAAKPTDTLQAGFSLTGAEYDRIEASAYVSGPITDRLRARVALRKEYMGPWQISASRPGDRLGKVDKLFGRLLVDWEPADGITLALNVNGWQDRSDAQAGQFVGLLSNRSPLMNVQPLTIGNPRRADWDADGDFRIDDDFWQASLRADIELGGDFVLTSISAYERLDRYAFVDADGTPVQNFAALNVGLIKTFSQELRISGQVGDALRFIVGGNYQHDTLDDTFQPQARDSSFPFDIASAIGLNKVDSYAVFGNVDWEITPELKATGGIRYSKQDRAYEYCLYDSGAGDLAAVVSATSTRLSGTPTVIAPGGCVTLSSTTFKPEVFRSNLNEDNISWKLGLNWQVDPRSLLYATVSKGYKNGIFITSGATFAAQLDPATQESVLAYEAGFKLGLLNRTMQLNGAIFYYDYRDKQIRGRIIDPVLGGLNKLINIPESRIQGAELQLIWEPVEGLTFNGGATVVSSKIKGNFTNFTPLGVQKLMTGEPFPLTPKWQLSGDLQYDFAVGGNVNMFVGGSATYQSSTNSALGQAAIFDITDYVLADLRIGIRDSDDTWRLTGFVQNVGNKYYWNNVAFNGPDAAVRYAGRPRTFGVTGTYRFR
jgi:iron complex outermembrane receptor protein